MPDLVNLPQHLEGPLVVGDFLDDVLQLGLAMEVAPHEVLASADQLQVLEFIKGVEVKGLDGLAYSCFHNSL